MLTNHPEPVPNARILALFAKQPQPGSAKTRLAATTSATWAATVAEVFLLDLLDRFATTAHERFLAFTPADAQEYFGRIAGGRYQICPQSGGDLGARLASFINGRLRSDRERIVIVGTDSPTLPPALVEQAFEELVTADVVLGPALDGGYYLLGCTRELPPIFHGVAWSGPNVLADTIARLADPAWRVALLPPWYDVDTLDDWYVLRGHVLAMRRAGVDPGVPRTERLLSCPPP
jgi:rSAM/selenodomain-associated transferase 1